MGHEFQQTGRDNTYGLVRLRTAPTCPVVTSVTDGQQLAYGTKNVLVEWDAVPGALNYQVYFWRAIDDMPIRPRWTTTSLSQNILGLKNETAYHVLVLATNPAGKSTGCSTIDFEVSGPVIPDLSREIKPLVMNWITFGTNTTDEAQGRMVHATSFPTTPVVVTRPDGRGSLQLVEHFDGVSTIQNMLYVDQNPGTKGVSPCVIGPQFGWTLGITAEVDVVPDFTYLGDTNAFGATALFATTQRTSGGSAVGFGFYRSAGQTYFCITAQKVIDTISPATNLIPSLAPVEAGRKYILHNVYNRDADQLEFYVDHVLQGTLAISHSPIVESGNIRLQWRFGGMAASDQAITLYLRDFFFAIDGLNQDQREWLYEGNTYLRPYSDVKAGVYTETLDEHIALWFKDYVKFDGSTENIGNAGRGNATLLSSVGGNAPTLDTSLDHPLPGPLASSGYLKIQEESSYAQYDAIDMTGSGVYGAVGFGFNSSDTGFPNEPHYMKWGKRYRTTPNPPTNYYAESRLWTQYYDPAGVNFNTGGGFFVGNVARMYSSFISDAAGGANNDQWNHFAHIKIPRNSNTYNAFDQGYSVVNGVLTISNIAILNFTNGRPEYDTNLTHILSGGGTGSFTGVQRLAHVGNIFGGTELPHPSYFVKLYHLLTGY